MRYVLLTSAYNEEGYITETIKSILSQTCLPQQWIIVSDGSTDSTDEIIKEYAENHTLMTYVRFQNPEKITSNLGRISKRVVACIQEGLKHINCNEFQFIGNIDADTTIRPDFFERLLNKFKKREQLGLSGGYIFNIADSKRLPYFTKPEQVGGPLQVFRRECWEQIGGYYPGGHHDYFAVARCKMHGWDVRSFEDLEVVHHKNVSTERKSQLRTKLHLGQMDYICGELFVYSLFRALSTIDKQPFIIGCFLRIAGYLFAAITGKPQQIPITLKNYLRKEQVEKIKGYAKKHLSSICSSP